MCNILSSKCWDKFCILLGICALFCKTYLWAYVMLFLFFNHRRASADETTRETSNTSVFAGVYEDVCLSVCMSVHTNFDPHVCLYLLQKQKLQIKQRRLTERRWTEQRYNHYYATKKENLWWGSFIIFGLTLLDSSLKDGEWILNINQK